MAQLLDGVGFVTGAASGIGQGVAFGLVHHGIQSIALVDVNEVSLAATAKDLKSRYPSIGVLQQVLDVTSEEAIQAALDLTVERFGRVDIAVNNAGVSGPRGPATDVTFKDWKAAIDINLHGVWLCQRAEITQMLKQEIIHPRRGRGTIINMASMYGTVGISSPQPATAYSASKHAVVGLTKTDANTFAQHGIRINAICPGYVETPLLQAATNDGSMDGEIAKTPMKRLGGVEEIVDCIVFLASPMSSFMTGAVLVADGGYTAS